jgi:hypothetical protein
MNNDALHTARFALLVARSVAAMLLLPSMAAADSRVQGGAPNAPISATAHVNFKIVIPKVLYVQLGTGNDRAVGAETVAIMTNSHNVTLNAMERTPNALTRGNVILSAPRRMIIAQDAPCTLGLSRAAASPESRGAGNFALRRVFCTVSMP